MPRRHSAARLVQLKLSQHRVKVKVRGKWKLARRGAGSFVVPKSATEYRIEFKPYKRWLSVQYVKGKRKAALNLGPGRIAKAMRASDKTTRPFTTTFEHITKVLKGAAWQLRPRAQRALPQWEKGWVFFNEVAETRKRWGQVAIWYAVEAEQFSDGSTPLTMPDEERRAYYVDAAFRNVKKNSRLSERLLESFHDLVADAVSKDVGDHNAQVAQGKAKFRWRATWVLLGVEGSTHAVSGAVKVRNKAKRSRAGGKIPKA